MTVHVFEKSLALSHQHESSPWWDAIYQTAFPGFLSAVSVRDDGWAQRAGIDRVVTLKSGKTVTIDEKVRDKSYNDILLERWSDRGSNIPGWVQKDLACDFIAYALVPDRRCYLIPFMLLRRAWQQNGRTWIDKANQRADGFRTVEAHNVGSFGRGYITESVAVPTATLLSALQNAQVIDWPAESATA
jgi:hypothetical protein